MRNRRASFRRRASSAALLGWIVFGVLLVAVVGVLLYKQSLSTEEPPLETAENELFIPDETDAQFPTPVIVDPVWSIEAAQDGLEPWFEKVHDWVAAKTADLIPYQEAKGLPELWAARRAMDRADAKARVLMVKVVAWAERTITEQEAQQYGVDPEDIADGSPLTKTIEGLPVGAILALFQLRTWDARHFDHVARGLSAPTDQPVNTRQQADADRFHGYLETLVIRDCRKNVLRHHLSGSPYHKDERYLDAPEFRKEYGLARARVSKLLQDEHWSTLHSLMNALYGWEYTRQDFDRQRNAARAAGLLTTPDPYKKLVR